MGGPQSPGDAGGVEDFLEHFGVKGMKWGRRKSEGNSAVKDRRGSPIKKTADGEGYVNAKGVRLANDAVRVRQNQTLAKQAGTDVLPTKDLQELVTRLNLEQQYSRLDPKQISAGAKFLQDAGPILLTKTVPSIVQGISSGDISKPEFLGKLAVEGAMAGLKSRK